MLAPAGAPQVFSFAGSQVFAAPAPSRFCRHIRNFAGRLCGARKKPLRLIRNQQRIAWRHWRNGKRLAGHRCGGVADFSGVVGEDGLNGRFRWNFDPRSFGSSRPIAEVRCYVSINQFLKLAK